MCWKFLKAPWPKHCKTYCHESQLRSIGKFSGQAASLLPPASLKWLRWQHLSTGTTLSLTVYYIECFPVPLTVRTCPFLLLCHHRGVTNFVLQLAILCRHVWTFFFQIQACSCVDSGLPTSEVVLVISLCLHCPQKGWYQVTSGWMSWHLGTIQQLSIANGLPRSRQSQD